MNRTAFKSDLKMIIREPILLIILVLPMFIFIIFKLAIYFGELYLYRFLGIELWNYYGYILSGVFLMTPFMLGTVAGFLMIDERDIRIGELIAITPIGYTGYLINRLLIPFIGSIIYTFCAYYILNIYYIETKLLIYISVILGLQGIFIGLILYLVADDKVKGLTYAKGMNIFIILAMADLINVSWVKYIGSITPFYWITKLIVEQSKVYTIIISIIINTTYLLIIIGLSKRVKEI